jgi:glutathione synthase/RimK-type ligase-like ATP-grasp enzyme
MDAPVFILSSSHDPHASALAWALQRNGVSSRLNPSVRVDQNTRISISINEHGQQHVTMDGLDAQRVRSIWHRRPMLPEAGQCLEADRNFIKGQWKYLQKNIFDLANNLVDTLWVNRPAAADFAESKLAQLQAAHAAGLKVPDTVIGNDAMNVAALIARWNRVVFKTFYPQHWQSESSGRDYQMSVALLDAGTPLPDAAIGVSPSIYQRYIDKVFDVRVTIIGGKLFAIQMQKSNGEAYFDWRPYSCDENMRSTAFSVSTALETKLRDVMQRLGIVFGCVDLVVDRQGDIYFLEVNQAGAFLFVEESVPELPILRAMAAMLSAGRTDYSIDDCVDVRFSSYLDSDEYREINTIQHDTGQQVAIEP